MAEQHSTPMKAAPITITKFAICEDGTLALVFALDDPRHRSHDDPLWPKPFVLRLNVIEANPELARSLVAQYEAADASPEAEQVRQTNAFLGKLMGL